MKQLLKSEICKERTNAVAIGAFNKAVGLGAIYNSIQARKEITHAKNAESNGRKPSDSSISTIGDLLGVSKGKALSLIEADKLGAGNSKKTLQNAKELRKLANKKARKEAIEKGYVARGSDRVYSK